MIQLARQNPDVFLIETLGTGGGCSACCESCGAYSKRGDESPADAIPKEVDEERMRAMLNREVKLVLGDGDRIPGFEAGSSEPKNLEVKDPLGLTIDSTRHRVFDWLARVVTTNVNVEPLNSDAWLTLAKIIREFSEEDQKREAAQAAKEHREPKNVRKTLACITHGLLLTPSQLKNKTWRDSDQARRLKEIVAFMQEGDVFILSLDCARLRGKITQEQNERSYLETLDMIKGLRDKGVKVKVSIQGLDVGAFKSEEDAHNSPFYREKAIDLFGRLKRRLVKERGWTPSEVSPQKLDFDTSRVWTRIGRAKTAILWISAYEGRCPVIPDPDVVKTAFPESQVTAGFYDFVTGKLFRRDALHDRSYGYTAALSLWLAGHKKDLFGWDEMDVSPDSVEDLTAQFSVAARLAMRREIHADRAHDGGVPDTRQMGSRSTPPVPMHSPIGTAPIRPPAFPIPSTIETPVVPPPSGAVVPSNGEDASDFEIDLEVEP